MNPYGGEGPFNVGQVDPLGWDGRGTFEQRLAGVAALGNGDDPGPLIEEAVDDEDAHSDGLAGQPADDWFHDDSSVDDASHGSPPREGETPATDCDDDSTDGEGPLGEVVPAGDYRFQPEQLKTWRAAESSAGVKQQTTKKQKAEKVTKEVVAPVLPADGGHFVPAVAFGGPP